MLLFVAVHGHWKYSEYRTRVLILQTIIMRLDLFLKVSRLMPRRTVAQEFCDAGRISVNGMKAKSSRDVKAGDELEIRRTHKYLKVLVKDLPTGKQVSKQAAPDLYEIVEQREVSDDEN